MVGRPNVGKSTLTNSLIGEKIAIMSDRPQTTRNKIMCIMNTDNAQIMFLDTPGIHKPQHKLGEYMMSAVKDALDGAVDEVKVSTRLKTHPVCLSSGEGVTFEMEKYFKAAQPELGLKAKRILELNVDHPAFLAFETARLTDPEKAKKYARIFYNQAQLIAGLPIDDPSAYTDLLCSLWQ